MTPSAWSTRTASPASPAVCWSASSPTRGWLDYPGVGKTPSIAATGVIYGNWNLLKWQLCAGLWVIVCSAVATFILLKMVGVFIPLRMSDEKMEIGDTAEHGHEVYPSDVPSLGYPNGIPGIATAGAGHSTPTPA